jgi:hypothetical protein
LLRNGIINKRYIFKRNKKEKNELRQADKSKGGYLNIKARTIDEEQKIKNLKTLGVRDNVPYVDLVFEVIDLVLASHRFKFEGNPQVTFTSPLLPEPVFNKCKCGKTASIKAFHVSSGKEYCFCKSCFGEVPMRYDVKVWRLL